MTSFLDLRKSSRKDNSELPQCKIAIMGDCSTQHLATAVKGEAFNRGLGANVLDCDYDQVKLLVLDPNSELYSFDPEYVFVQLCTEKLYQRYLAKSQDERKSFWRDELQTVVSTWERMEAQSSMRILQANFPEYDDRIFGDFSARVDWSFIRQLRLLNAHLMEAADEHAQVGIIDLLGLQVEMGSSLFEDARLYASSKMPLTLDAVCRVAERIVDAVQARRGAVRKCVVADLDNTLWGGVIGDDGMSGIQIGELGTGAAFTALQHWLKELSQRGIILTVCSKNQDDIAREPFEHHPEMVLRLDDIAVFVANWEDKASNVRYIQETLNIGADSMVFLDDNPFERELVKKALPEVAVPDLPDDPAERLGYLRRLNLFETASFSSGDVQRTGQYIAEGKRKLASKQFDDYDGYLQSLSMHAVVKPFDEFQCPRIAQLTQRSNQFNLRTQRYQESDIAEIMVDERYVTRYFMLSDSFGDYGLISLVIMKKTEDGKSLFVDTWIMSCRVLKRGVEEFVMNKLVSDARELGYERIVGEYIPTKKNAMVASLYEEMGFEKNSAGQFELVLSGYEPKKTFVLEINTDQ